MKQLLTSIFLVMVFSAAAQKISAPKPVADSALGIWIIDLRPTPES